MKERPYEIVEAMGLEDLTAKVNALAARGYRPLGCLLRIPAVGYRQPMWKEPRLIEESGHPQLAKTRLNKAA